MASISEFPTIIAKQSKYQAVTDALVDKARSYDLQGDTSNIYRAKHYYKAAEMYADEKTKYDDEGVPNVIAYGKIGDFCKDFLKNNPPRAQQQEKEPQVEEQGRRSARLAAKPKKSYKATDPYDSEDIPDDAEEDDPKDEDYQPADEEESEDEEEESETMRLFRKKTAKYGLTEEQLSQVVTVFEAYYEANKDDKQNNYFWYQDYDWSTYQKKDWQMYKLRDVIDNYIMDNIGYSWDVITNQPRKWDNPILKETILKYTYTNTMKKEVEKVGLEYDERLMGGFWKWYNDSANNDKVQHRSKWSKEPVYYPNSKPEVVRAYIKTIPKRFIF
jgi:hypothetical protein